MLGSGAAAGRAAAVGGRRGSSYIDSVILPDGWRAGREVRATRSWARWKGFMWSAGNQYGHPPRCVRSAHRSPGCGDRWHADTVIGAAPPFYSLARLGFWN
jgi:hypothetical protein